MDNKGDNSAQVPAAYNSVAQGATATATKIATRTVTETITIHSIEESSARPGLGARFRACLTSQETSQQDAEDWLISQLDNTGPLLQAWYTH